MDDVGPPDEPAEHLLALGPGQIDGEAALAPVGGLPHVVLEAPHRVAGQRLDLDDVAAEVPEEHGRQGTGQEGAEVEDLQALQRSPGRGLAGTAAYFCRCEVFDGARVLAEAGRRTTDPRRRRGLEGRAGLADRAPVRVVPVDDEAVLDHVVLTEDLTQGNDELHSYVGRPQRLQPFLARGLTHRTGHERGVEGRARLAQVGQDLLGEGQRAHVDAVTGVHDLQVPAVAALIEGQVGERDATLHHRARRSLDTDPLNVHREQEPLKEGGVGRASPPHPLTVQEPGEDAGHGQIGRPPAGRGKAPQDWSLPPRGHGVHQPAVGLHQDVVTGLLDGGVTRGVSEHGRHHQPGPAGKERLVIEAEGGRLRRAQTVHEHVGRRHQLVELGPVALLMEVEHDAALAPVPGGEGLGRQDAEGIAAWWLDLDHVGSRLGQDLGGDRPTQTP